MKKFFMMLPVMVALVALVGCSKTTDKEVSGENLNEDSPYYNQFEIADYGIFGEPALIAGTEGQFQISEELTVTAQLANFELYAWDSNVNYDETQGFSGAGHFITGIVPIYYITAPADYAGYILTPETIKIGSTTTPAEGVMAAGTIDPATYGDWINFMMFDETQTVDSAKIFGKTKGALLSACDMDEQAMEFAYGIYRGALNNLVINLDEDGEVDTWGADVQWSNMTGDQRCYGFHFTAPDGGDPVMTKPYNYRSVNRKFHEDVLNAAPKAPAKNATRKITLMKAHPALVK